jgi:hypothetical protein
VAETRAPIHHHFAREPLTQPGRESGITFFGMEAKVRKAIFLVFALALFWNYSENAQGATFDIDLSALPTAGGSGGGTLPYCFHGFCARYTISPIYVLSGLGLPAGSTVDFGDLTYGSIGFCGPSMCGESDPFFAVAFNGQTLPNPLNGFWFGSPSDCSGLSCTEKDPPSQVAHLVFGVTDSIQFEYTTPASFIAPPVPEPATWAMMILGFVGIGAMTYRRRKGPMLAA